MSENQNRPWRCHGNHGHIIGITVRNGKGIRQLILYRNAIDDTVETGRTEVDVIGVIEGLVMKIRCNVCGAIRTWEPGEESLKRLLERVDRVHNFAIAEKE